MMVGLATVYSGIIWTSNCLLGLFLITLCLGSVGCCVGWKFAIYLVIN